jgi:hypothetical protein
VQQFSGPEINPSDIIITEKISDDEKSSYGAVLKVRCRRLLAWSRVAADHDLESRFKLFRLVV